MSLRAFSSYRPLYMLALSVLIWCGCSSTASQKKETQKHSRLVTALYADPPNLDPRRGVDNLSEGVLRMLFTGLTYSNKESVTTLALAERYTLSPDHKIYTFYLKDTKWSDGSLLTAYDFEETWKTILEPSFAAPSVNLFYLIKNAKEVKKGNLPLDSIGIKALDTRTLRIELEHPHAKFLDMLSNSTFYPVHKSMREKPKDFNHYISCGPFKLNHYVLQNDILLEKNPFYFEAESVKLDELCFYIVKNENTAYLLFQKGEIDCLGSDLCNVPLDLQNRLRKDGFLFPFSGAITSWLLFNHQIPPLNNVKVRKALALAIDRGSIVENILFQLASPALSLIPKAQKKEKWHSYFQDGNIAEAKRLFAEGLKEEGMTVDTLPSLTITSTQAEVWIKIFLAIQDQWSKVLGFKVNIENLDLPVLLQKLSKKEYQIARFGWSAQYDDPANFLDIFSAKEHVYNQSGWANSTLKALLQKAELTTAEEERWTYLEQAETIFFEEMPVCPLIHMDNSLIQQPYVKDVIISPLTAIDFRWAWIDK